MTRADISSPSRAENGFSLIEAVVMLAVAGMALMLIFSVATRATQAGFRLGRHALATADRELADDAFRGLVAGLEVAPTSADPVRLRIAPFEGRPDGFEGSAVLGHAGPCAPAGPASPLQVRVLRTAAGDQLVCRAGGRRAVLFDLPGRRLSLAYSGDGRSWTGRWTDRPLFAASASTAPRRSRRLFVRLASSDGRFEVVAATPARRPELFIDTPTAGGPS